MVSPASMPESSIAAETSAAEGTVDHATIYGQFHPNETPELISKGFTELEEELTRLDDDKKVGWAKANATCPQLVGNDHKLMFLRSEVFNADLAALRLVKYWDMRRKLFGDDRAFKPFTLDDDGAMGGVSYGLKLGFLMTAGDRDEGGRSVLYANPAKFIKDYDKSEKKRISIAQALWYVAHSVLEEELTQQRGVVIIAYTGKAQLSKFDKKLMKINMESLKGCLPMRTAAFHVCHPPWFFGKIIFPFIKIIMGERMRKRVRAHMGTHDDVVEKLAALGLPKNVLSTDIGGSRDMDTDAWLEERLALGK